MAGALQLTAWKARHLACCREAPVRSLAAAAPAAWCHGLRLGLHCIRSSFGLMAILPVTGIINLGVMALVAAAIAAERLAPAGCARRAGHRARDRRGRAAPDRASRLHRLTPTGAVRENAPEPLGAEKDDGPATETRCGALSIQAAGTGSPPPIP